MGLLLACALPLFAQDSTAEFRWIDFHAEQDQNIAAWVQQSLAGANWTAIREIGVQYDAALVVTTERATPQSVPDADTFTVWTASLTSHDLAQLVSGVNLRWFAPMRFADGAPEELPALYDNCRECSASTYFTAFHYDIQSHAWAARWMRGTDAAPVWNASAPAGVNWTQVYAVLPEGDGHTELVTWTHLDNGKKRAADEILFRYDIVPITREDRTTILSLKESESMEVRLCRGVDAVSDLKRGQDSDLCRDLVGLKPERKPVTTPPANNRGQSAAGR